MKKNVLLLIIVSLIFGKICAISLFNVNPDPKTAADIGHGLGSGLVHGLTSLPAENFQKLTENIIRGASQGLEKLQPGSQADKAQTTAINFINKGVQGVVHKNLIKAAGIGIGTAASYYIVRYTIPLIFKMIERQLTRPKLIIESSQKTIAQKIAALFGQEIPIMSMVFTPKLEERLNKIVKVTETINKKIKSGKSNIKYRNLLLYGPPGTGKTLFATELAKRSGLEYVFMSGSSFSKFKEGEAIEALDELFAWANKSSGLLIFIDEAETFLAKRENMKPDSSAYLLLNNFLNYTGTRSNKFMLVFATNNKNILDSAMHRRIDDLIEMPLPTKPERIRMLTLYKDTILMDVKQNEKNFVDSVKEVLTSAVINQMADQTEGLSGGELEGIINAIKTDTEILEPSLVTQEIVDAIVEQFVAKHCAFISNENSQEFLAPIKPITL